MRPAPKDGKDGCCRRRGTPREMGFNEARPEGREGHGGGYGSVCRGGASMRPAPKDGKDSVHELDDGKKKELQ